MAKIAEASEEALIEVDGVGPELAASVQHFFGSDAGRKTWQDLRDAGVNMQQPKARARADQPLSGKTLVVTGTLKQHTRGEIENNIREMGGKTSSNVSSKTDYLIAGEKAGSKLVKARKLGIAVLSEGEFLEMIGRDSS